MLMSTAFEGLEAIVADFTNYAVWEAVPSLDCSVDKGPASRVGS